MEDLIKIGELTNDIVEKIKSEKWRLIMGEPVADISRAAFKNRQEEGHIFFLLKE